MGLRRSENNAMKNKFKERSEKMLLSDQADVKFINLSLIECLECNY